MGEHAKIRASVRERQRWHGLASAARRDVARLRKGAVGESGLPALTGQAHAGPIEQAEIRLHEAMQRLAELDERLLGIFTELESVDAVRLPWAALVQIQAEFFTAQQSTWAPLADAFEEFVSSPEPPCGAAPSAGAVR